MLENIEPKEVLKFFETISYIPRGSGNEKQISDYLLNFAKERNLWVVQDKELNVIIKKSGTKGYENSPAVIIQGHMDMVCEKNKDTIHDFSRDALKLIVNDDYIKANGTTLGADNGIAIAMGLALLDSSAIAHPPIEVLFTTNEEVGLIGAAAVDGSLFEGKLLLNIDSEEEGIFTTSCAGGVRTDLSLDIEWCEVAPNCCGKVLKVKGLKGGHSGLEIHKQRGNSNVLLARTLRILQDKFSVLFTDANGGSKDNAIPREAEATIVFEKDKMDDVLNELEKIQEMFKREFEVSDDGLTLFLEDGEVEVKRTFSKELCKKIVFALILIPKGVQTVSLSIEDLVESSCNAGVLKTTDNEVNISCSIRSSVISKRTFLIEQVKVVAELIGARFGERGKYPAWEYKKESVLREKTMKVYKEMFGKDPEITAIHAGLECGLFAEKIEGIDMISFGPNIYDAHTPDERMSISSVSRSWEFFKKLLIELA